MVILYWVPPNAIQNRKSVQIDPAPMLHSSVHHTFALHCPCSKQYNTPAMCWLQVKIYCHDLVEYAMISLVGYRASSQLQSQLLGSCTILYSNCIAEQGRAMQLCAWTSLKQVLDAPSRSALPPGRTWREQPGECNSVWRRPIFAELAQRNLWSGWVATPAVREAPSNC